MSECAYCAPDELCALHVGTLAAAFREEDHPRDPGGDDGGQFIPKDADPADESEADSGFDVTEIPEAARAPATAAAAAIRKAGVDIPGVTPIVELPDDDAATARRLRDGTIGIHSDSSPATLQEAIVHEYGHMLDSRVMGHEDEWATQTQELDPLYQAAKSSPTIKRILADEVPLLKGDQQTRAYMTQGREMFARAFSQYVATKSGDPVLVKELRRLQADEQLGFQVWQDDEFEPIAEELDKVLRAKGLTAAAWDESEHPRHPAGSERGGEFAPSDTFVGKQGYDRGPGRVRIEGERPRMPTADVFAQPWRELDEAVTYEGWRELDPDYEEVDVADLVPTQDQMSAVRVQEYVLELEEDGNLSELLDSTRVVEGDDGRLYVADGHNRVAAAIAKGHARLRLPVIRPSLTAAAWDETKHPREPAGSDKGGEFRSTDGEPTDADVEAAFRENNIDDASIVAGVRHALDEMPDRLTHGDTGKHGFFLVDGRAYVHNDWREIPREARTRAVSVHSHAPDGVTVPSQIENYFPGEGPGHNDPFSTGDLKLLDELVRKGNGAPRIVVLHGDGTMDIIGYGLATDMNALHRKSAKTLQKEIFGTYEEAAANYEATGESSLSRSRRQLREWAAAKKFDYREGVRWATPEEVKTLRMSHSSDSLRAAAWEEAAHPRHPAGSDRGGEFAPKGFYYGAMMAREGDDERGRAVGYQAYRMERLGGKKGNRTLVGPVRDTIQEASADADAAFEMELSAGEPFGDAEAYAAWLAANQETVEGAPPKPGAGLLETIMREREQRVPHSEPEYDERLRGMWFPDDEEFIFEADDPGYTTPIWKASRLSETGEWKFWITDKMGNPHHDAVEKRLGWSHLGTGRYSGDSLQTAAENPGSPNRIPLNPELQERLSRHARRWHDAAERAQELRSMTAAAGPVTAAGFNRLVAQHRRELDRLEKPLARAYRTGIRKVGRQIVKRFEKAVETPAIALAAAATWQPPTVAEILAGADEIVAELDRAEKLRGRAFEQMVEGILRRLGISFEVTSIISQVLLNGLAARSTEMIEGIRTPVARAIANSYLNGLSVPDTAAAILEAVDGLADWQATQLARNDLVGIANGGSLLAARMVRERFPEVGLAYKEWLATDDERTRPTHVEAHGQLVELGTPFVVGDARLAYPGDPNGPDGEVINCRCTLIYRDAPEAVSAAVWNEADHPRDPGGEGGGQFVRKDTAFRDLPLAERRAFMDAISRAQKFADNWRQTHITDMTQDEIDSYQEEIDEYAEDGDPDDMIEMTRADMQRSLDAQSAIRTALDRIADLHTLPADADKINVQLAPLGSQTWGDHYAETWVPGSTAEDTETHSKRIRLNPEKPATDHQGTFTHEFGHYVDVQLGGHRGPEITGQWFSKQEGAAGWRAAVHGTEAVKALRRYERTDPTYVGYLLTDEELWARSYAQWVADRTGDDELMRSVLAPGERDGLPERQWDPADFGPVASELDKIMERYAKP